MVRKDEIKTLPVRVIFILLGPNLTYIKFLNRNLDRQTRKWLQQVLRDVLNMYVIIKMIYAFAGVRINEHIKFV